jgi:hypothetical protein
VTRAAAAAPAPPPERDSDEAAPARPARTTRSTKPANTNTSALVETWPIGDPRTTARLLARLLVRRALTDVGIVRDDPQPEKQNRTKYPTRSGVTLSEPEEDQR